MLTELVEIKTPITVSLMMLRAGVANMMLNGESTHLSVPLELKQEQT